MGISLFLVGTLATQKIIDNNSIQSNQQKDDYYLSNEYINDSSGIQFTGNEETYSDDYYVIRDQLILDELDLEVKDNKLIRTKKSETPNANSQLKSLNSKINKNSDMEKRLIKIITDDEQENKDIAAIGFSTIYFDTTVRMEGEDLEPLTFTEFESYEESGIVGDVYHQSLDADDLLIQTSGTPTSYGSLTLSIVISIDNWNTDLAFATSYADWDEPSWYEELFGDDKYLPDSSNTDYVTLTHPSCYYLDSENLSGTCTDVFRKLKTYSSVVYGFDENPGRTMLSTCGELISTPSGTREWTTTYVHSWETIAPSFSVSSTGVSVSGTPSDKAWQLTSYINY